MPNAGQFHFAGDGSINVAPVGTAMPATVVAALNASFVNVGYTTEDGVTITPSRSLATVNSWQTQYPTARRIESRDMVATASVQELFHVTWNLAFGGGTWAANGTEWSWTNPAESLVDTRAVVFEFIDGADITRLLVPQMLVTDVGDIVWRRNQESALPLTFSLIYSGVGEPFTALTNRAEMNPAA